MIELAKYQVDLGLYTNQREPMLKFWCEKAGLLLESDLPVGGGVMQHRHEHRGSVIKVNHCRDTLNSNEPASGYARLLLARSDITMPQSLLDPDGNQVALVPPGYQGISQLGVIIHCSDIKAHSHFWSDAIGLPPAPRAGEYGFQCGDSVIILEPSSTAPTGESNLNAPGYRYLTLQVWDCDAAHKAACAAGAIAPRPPSTHGKVARYSFIQDPDGNWIELSQRASLTGPVA